MDYEKTVELGNVNIWPVPVAVMRILLIDLRVGKTLAEVQAKARAFKERAKPTGWHERLFTFFSGEIGEGTLFKAARSDNPKTEKEQLCEAYFFAGTVRLATGDKAGGRELLEKCLATGVSYYTEYVSAKYELERLKKAGASGVAPPPETQPRAPAPQVPGPKD
jgi:lipoprotein NlpI